VEDTFKCGDNTCIPNSRVCDMYEDCKDGSDERSCQWKYSTCEDLWEGGLTENKTYLIEGKTYITILIQNNFNFYVNISFPITNHLMHV
jgi:hypothetical protein